MPEVNETEPLDTVPAMGYTETPEGIASILERTVTSSLSQRLLPSSYRGRDRSISELHDPYGHGTYGGAGCSCPMCRPVERSERGATEGQASRRAARDVREAAYEFVTSRFSGPSEMVRAGSLVDLLRDFYMQVTREPRNNEGRGMEYRYPTGLRRIRDLELENVRLRDEIRRQNELSYLSRTTTAVQTETKVEVQSIESGRQFRNELYEEREVRT